MLSRSTSASRQWTVALAKYTCQFGLNWNQIYKSKFRFGLEIPVLVVAVVAIYFPYLLMPSISNVYVAIKGDHNL